MDAVVDYLPSPLDIPPSVGYVQDTMEEIEIPVGTNTEDIKVRQQIIRDFYRQWKEKNPTQRKYNLT